MLRRRGVFFMYQALVLIVRISSRGREQYVGVQPHSVVRVGILEVDQAITANNKGGGNRQDMMAFPGNNFQVDIVSQITLEGLIINPERQAESPRRIELGIG